MFQQEDNRTKTKRENYAVEIRNQSRLAIFQQKRNQFASQQQTLFKYIPKNFLDLFKEGEIQQFILETLINPVNSLPYILEGLKIINEKKKSIKVYKILQQKLLELINPIIGLLSSKEEYLSQLAFYHLLNIIYYLDQPQLQLFYNMAGFKELCYFIKDSTLEFMKQEKFEVSAFGFFTLANILSEKTLILQHQFISIFHQGLLNEIKDLQANFKSSPCVNYVHGSLWVLNNLTYLSNNVYTQLLDILQQMIPLVEMYQKNNKDLSYQICQDYLQNLSTTTRNMNNEEISDIFSTHIQIIIFLVSNNWDQSVHLELSEIFRNLLYGEDDAIEQLLSLGLTEILIQLMKSQNDEVIEEVIGCIRNIFGAEDEELITTFLSQNQVFFLKDLLSRSSQGNKLQIRNEAMGAIQVLLTNYRESAEIIIKLGGVQTFLSIIQEVLECSELINDTMSALYSLLEYDSSINLNQVRQIITSFNGESILSHYLDCENQLTMTLAYKLIGFINND